jgi:hypothetical protein
MTETSARTLAAVIREAVAGSVEVRPEGRYFVVVVRVADRTLAVRVADRTFTVRDEEDWRLLKPQLGPGS